MILKVQFCLIFNSITQLNELIKKSVDDRQNLLDKIKKIETEMKSLSQNMENINSINNIVKFINVTRKILKISNLQRNIIVSFLFIK